MKRKKAVGVIKRRRRKVGLWITTITLFLVTITGIVGVIFYLYARQKMEIMALLPIRGQSEGELKRIEELEKTILTRETLPILSFSDVPADSEYTDVLRYLFYYGYLEGMGTDQFLPYEKADRGTLITMLYRLSGEGKQEYDGRFSDVAEHLWYSDAVAWGVKNGVMSGVTEMQFAPTQPITRSQLAVILTRAAAILGYSLPAAADLSLYPDAYLIKADETEAMEKVIGSGLYRLLVGNELLPNMPVSRQQLASVITALCALKGDGLAEEIMVVSSAQKEREGLDRERTQLAVNAAAEKYGAIGLQVAVVQKGKVTDTFSYGWATKQTEEMTANHKLRCASISKVVVGIAAMLLHEEGMVELDKSIGTYWGMEIVNPLYKDKPISIRSILTHTSSIVNAGDDVSRSYDQVRTKLANSYFSGDEPGAEISWNYNNYAFGVLGMTLELTANRYLTDVLREHLFQAMNIDGAFYAGELLNTNQLATLYRNGGGVARTVEAQQKMRHPGHPGASGSSFAGGLAISAADLAKLAALLAEDGIYEGVQLMSPDSIAIMETVFPVSDGSYQGIPLRYRKNIYGREEIYYHTGSAYGVFNCMSYDPNTGDGVVVLTTGALGSKDEYHIYDVCSEIAAYIYQELNYE